MDDWAGTTSGVIVFRIEPVRPLPSWQAVSAAAAHAAARWVDVTGLNPPPTFAAAAGSGWDAFITAAAGYTYVHQGTMVHVTPACPPEDPAGRERFVCLPELPDRPSALPPPPPGAVAPPRLIVSFRGDDPPDIGGGVAGAVALGAAAACHPTAGVWLRHGGTVHVQCGDGAPAAGIPLAVPGVDAGAYLTEAPR